MRRLNTTHLKSAIRGTGPSQTRFMDDILSRFAANSDARDEDSMSGEDSAHGKDREGQEDERDRSVTPPPLVPNPPWMATPISPSPGAAVAATPKKGKLSTLDDDDNDNDSLLSKPIPLKRHTSLCISPNSSQYHHRTTFLTPARASGSTDRPYDASFPPIAPSSSSLLSSSPFRHAPISSDPVTPDRSSSTIRSTMFLQTPLFSSSFSDVRLEDELARMGADSESPGGIFRSSDLYRSPSLPGSTPNRWAGH